MKTHQVNTYNVLDTHSMIVKEKLIPQKSLQELGGLLFPNVAVKRKPPGRWTDANLSPNQISYALTDAWISFLVYEHLIRYKVAICGDPGLKFWA